MDKGTTAPSASSNALADIPHEAGARGGTDVRCESALPEADARYRAIFQQPFQYTVVLEVVRSDGGEICDWVYVDANDSALRMLRRDREDLIGQRLSEVLPERSERLLRLCGDVLEKQLSHRYETQWGGMHIMLTVFPVDSRTVASVGVDITDRKRVEQTLRETEARLRDEDRRKDEFLAVLGHELRNPLAPMKAAVELLGKAHERPDLIAKVRPMMQRQLDHVSRLVDDLLDLSRITRGQIRLKRAELDLRDVIEAAVEQCRQLVDARGHTLRVESADVPMRVEGDFQRLTEVISNLLSNAAKYSEPGGCLDVKAFERDGLACVSVLDNGIGIPPERLHKLFRMFSQVPEHQAYTGGGGLGIGLALSRQLVELHGGTIAAHSDGLGRGSEFVVCLPRRSVGEQTDHDDRLTAPRASSACRILVVDDNVDAAEALRMSLELEGHDVRAAYRGAEALTILESFSPDFAFLDIGMPGMDGWELARRIRALPIGRDVRLVAVTGWGQDEDKRRALDAGFDEHLTKPAGIDELRAALRSRVSDE